MPGPEIRAMLGSREPSVGNPFPITARVRFLSEILQLLTVDEPADRKYLQAHLSTQVSAAMRFDLSQFV